MNRHELEQLREKIGELKRFGSSNCVRQANDIMVENFENVLFSALNLTEPKSKPKHTIADNYPAGGLPEPCIFCEDYEQLQAENERLREALGEIADPCKLLSLELNLIKSNLTKGQWAKSVLNNTLSWDKGYMIIDQALKGE